MNFIFLIIFCLNNYFVDCCIRTSNPDETGGFIPTSTFIPTTTTSTSSSTTSSTTEGTTSSSTTTTTTTSFTAPPRCAPMAGQVLFFMSTEIPPQLFPDNYGVVPPVSSCAANSCSAGTANYYKGASTAAPHTNDAQTPAESIGSLVTDTCLNMCYCVSSNECFTAIESSTLTLWPYCDTTGFCAVYPFVSFGDFKGDMGTNLNALDFLNRTNNFTPFPVTMSPPYFPLKSLSCSGCPGTSACP